MHLLYTRHTHLTAVFLLSGNPRVRGQVQYTYEYTAQSGTSTGSDMQVSIMKS